MLYIKLGSDGKVAQFPYSLTDLIRENPTISFPSNLDADTAKDFNVFPVTEVAQPNINHRQNLTRWVEKTTTGWREKWSIVDATDSEIEERTNSASQSIREERNQKLGDSDWTQLPDAPAVNREAWAQYREALRDVTEQPGFPWDIEWPEPPIALNP